MSQRFLKVQEVIKILNCSQEQAIHYLTQNNYNLDDTINAYIDTYEGPQYLVPNDYHIDYSSQELNNITADQQNKLKNEVTNQQMTYKQLAKVDFKTAVTFLRYASGDHDKAIQMYYDFIAKQQQDQELAITHQTIAVKQELNRQNAENNHLVGQQPETRHLD
ncbi:Hypothetical_protein [Hexamita inflata]|uniref:Hypothetical_protein n=1 Tax=Hexamita inflata TaxID=28002 RepID=A0AA86UV72_9EUKA|nr:Hypothetical protein HINF_LOCUS60705 [Hexamita inflata]